MSVITITEENFEKVVMQSDKKILIDFWAAWCGPCRMFSTTIENLAAENPDFLIGKINIDEQQKLTQRFNVVSVPTLVLFEKGKEMKRATGVASKEAILQMVNGDA